MKKITNPAYFITIFLVLFSHVIQAGTVKYPVSEIPAALLKNAKAVIRSEEYVVQIYSINNARITHNLVITILNENAQKYAILNEVYDKFNRIENIREIIYNSLGEKVEQSNNIIDQSAIPGISLYDDNRVKYYEPKYRTYPYTVEFNIETVLTGYNDFPSWMPCKDFNIAVQKSTYQICTSNPGLFRSYCPDHILNPVIETKGSVTWWTWKIDNQQAVEEEPLCRSLAEYMPVVFFAPNNFSIGGFAGDMTSWKDFGNWVRSMNYSRNWLSEEKKAFILELIKDCPTKYEQAKKIYEYFQQVTRYVSIQIGVGGWQPMEALEVDRLGYGDCKALANYLQALLATANINSYYTLVQAGESAMPMMKEFPSQQFNHAIVCLPLENDTLWLECTDQKIPFGYNGTFTDDRYVLLISEQSGGHLTRTRRFNSKVNYRNRNIFITLDDNGDSKIKLYNKYSGMYFDDRFTLLSVDSEREKKMIYEDFVVPGLTLNSFDLNIVPGRDPLIREHLGCTVAKYSSITGNRMLVQLNRLFAPPALPKKITARKSPVYIRREYAQNDTINITLPEGYEIESLPGGVSLSSPFGNCEYTIVSRGENLIQYTRNLVMNGGTYLPELYPEFRNFITSVTYNDGMKVCLKKK